MKKAAGTKTYKIKTSENELTTITCNNTTSYITIKYNEKEIDYYFDDQSTLANLKNDLEKTLQIPKVAQNLKRAYGTKSLTDKNLNHVLLVDYHFFEGEKITLTNKPAKNIALPKNNHPIPSFFTKTKTMKERPFYTNTMPHYGTFKI